MLSNNKRTAVFVGASFLVVATCAVVAWFLFGVISEESANVKDAETSIAILEKKTRDLSEAKEGLARHQDDVASIDKSFLSEERFVDFVRLVEKTARTAGVALQVSNAELPGSAGGTMRTSMDVTGSFENLAHFVILLDHLPYPSIIANASFVPEIAGRSDKVRMTFRMDVFNFRSQ